jgi:glycosyltransferase involved in cell wall biosynthesis
MPEQYPRSADDFAGVFTRDYIAAIATRCDVTVLMPGHTVRPGLARRRDDSGVEFLTWSPWPPGHGPRRQRLGRLETLAALGTLARHVRGVDLIHAHGPVFHGVPARRLGAKLNIPVVVTVHTNPFSKLLRRRTVRRLTRSTLEGVDCVLPVSEDLRRQIEAAGMQPRRVEVTHNPVDTDLFRPAAVPAESRRILFAGRLEEYKGALRVARAFAQIAERWPDWTLAIAGDGPERGEIERYLAANPGLAPRVELLGAFSRPQLADYLTRSEVFVFPSRHETFGLVLAEAMSAGLPVVAPNCGAPPEFVDASNGCLVDPDDIESIARGLDELIRTREQFDPQALRERVVERFGHAAFGARLSDLYADILERGAVRCAA